MASIAIPAIEAIALRVLAVLGIGVAGGVTIEEAEKRRKESDKAGDVPIARGDTKTGEKCKECPPDKGSIYTRSTAGWSAISIEYQARISGMPVGPGTIAEWLFNGVTFDGFVSSQCLLKEAKAKYDQFFDEYGMPKDWWSGRDNLIDEAMRQGSAAQPRPPIQLAWYFMQPLSYRYFSRIIQAAHPDVQVTYQP